MNPNSVLILVSDLCFLPHSYYSREVNPNICCSHCCSHVMEGKIQRMLVGCPRSKTWTHGNMFFILIIISSQKNPSCSHHSIEADLYLNILTFSDCFGQIKHAISGHYLGFLGEIVMHRFYCFMTF